MSRDEDEGSAIEGWLRHWPSDRRTTEQVVDDCQAQPTFRRRHLRVSLVHTWFRTVALKLRSSVLRAAANRGWSCSSRCKEFVFRDKLRLIAMTDIPRVRLASIASDKGTSIARGRFGL